MPCLQQGRRCLNAVRGFERTVRLETPVLDTLQTGVTTAAVTSLQGRSMGRCHSAAAASGATRLPCVYGAECRHAGLEQSLGASFISSQKGFGKKVLHAHEQTEGDWMSSV